MGREGEGRGIILGGGSARVAHEGRKIGQQGLEAMDQGAVFMVLTGDLSLGACGERSAGATGSRVV